MVDRPDAATLLRAMARTLTDDVMPATQGGAQHAARVVANLCRILEREWLAGGEAEEATSRAMAALLDRPELGADWAEALDARLRSSDEAFDARARTLLLDDVRRRLDINRPGYDA